MLETNGIQVEVKKLDDQEYELLVTKGDKTVVLQSYRMFKVEKGEESEAHILNYCVLDMSHQYFSEDFDEFTYLIGVAKESHKYKDYHKELVENRNKLLTILTEEEISYLIDISCEIFDEE